jgi:hypothetical protein
MAREITLAGIQNITVTTKEEVTIPTDVVYIEWIIDYSNLAVARVSFGNQSGRTADLILWEGDDYINIGQWTDQQAMDRVKELLNVT